MELQAQDVTSKFSTTRRSQEAPAALDWLLPGALRSYKESGNPSDSGQVNPFMFTTTLAKLAEEKGVKVIHGSVDKLIYQDNNQKISSITYIAKGMTHELSATDVVIAAGPWTSKIFPSIQLKAPRGHSVVIRPSSELSPYILFPEIKPPKDGTIPNIILPEIYPRPSDEMFDFATVYASGPDDYNVALPNDTEHVEIDQQSCEDIWTAVQSVSEEIRNGEIVTKQACYKPQIRPHEDDEEVGPIVGPTSIKGVWLATGHDEWGIQNSAGTGLIMSEMILEGEAKSADCEALHPKHFLRQEHQGISS